MATTTLPRGAASTKKFKALLAVGLDRETAAKVYRQQVLGEVAEVPAAPDPIAQLVEAGFTEDEARKVINSGGAPEPVVEPVVEEVDPVAALVTKHGFDFAKGRVYLGADAIEAAVRVRKTGAPEIVASSRTDLRKPRAVAIYQGEQGEVIVQNLIREA